MESPGGCGLERKAIFPLTTCWFDIVAVGAIREGGEVQARLKKSGEKSKRQEKREPRKGNSQKARCRNDVAERLEHQ